MNIRHWLLGLLLVSTTLGPGTLLADDNILTARSAYDFDATLEELKKTIEEHGYTVAHVQLCDGGLSKMGYETDHYQVVFFGKVDEVREMSKRHPELVPFMPFKALIFAENDQAVVSIVNPETLLKLNPSLVDISPRVSEWKLAFADILKDVQAHNGITAKAANSHRRSSEHPS